MQPTAVTPSARPRIVHVAWLSEIGGGELFLLDLLRAVDAARFQQQVLALGSGGAVLDRVEALGCPVRRFPRTGRLGLGMMFCLARAVRRARPDIVQTHGEAGVFWGIPAARLAGRSAVVALLYQNCRNARHKMVAARALLRLPEAIVAGSADVKRFLVECLGVGGARCLVIPCGIDPVPFHLAAPGGASGGHTPRRPVVVTVGRLVAEKGHAVLLHAFARVRQRYDAELWIVGDGTLRGELEALAGDLGIREHVRFHGTVWPTTELLGRADVFAFPSLVEPQGLAVLEALAAGVPVVASRTGGIVEMIAHDVEGLLVRPGDPEALAAALGALLGDAGLRARLVAAGARRLADFDIRRVARRYEELWTALAAETGPAPRRTGPDMIDA
jgi:glycosyltransferase involved in cell wall biosynthesis